MFLSESLLETCDFSSDGETLFITPNRSPDFISQNVMRYAEDEIKAKLKKQGLRRAEIFRGAGLKPYQILATPASFSLFSEPGLQKVGRSNPVLASALDPFAEAEAEGKIVTIVSMLNDKCKHTNPALTIERGKRPAQEWTGYDYSKSWRLDGENLSEEYYDLRHLLRRDHQIKGYEYSLIRPDDGALVRYVTDYYLLDFFGEEVRVGVSDPGAYTILENGRGDRIIQ